MSRLETFCDHILEIVYAIISPRSSWKIYTCHSPQNSWCAFCLKLMLIPWFPAFNLIEPNQKKQLEKNIRNSSVFPGSFPEIHAFLVGASLIFTVLTLTWCEAGAHDPHSWWRVRKALANP
jgi:hypothetical protein